MRRGLGVMLALTCLMLAGCGSGPGAHPAGSGQGRQAVSPAVQPSPDRSGAPTAFDAAKGTPLPPAASQNTSLGGEQDGAPPVALDGFTAFITTGTAVQVVNTATGQVVGSVKPAHPVPDPAGQWTGLAGSGAAPPLIADTGAGHVALAGYVVQLAGHGTTPPSLAVEVDAITAGARLAWDIVAPLPGQPGQAPLLSGNPDVGLVGLSGSTAVAWIGDSDDGYSTMAFDIARRQPLWRSQTFLVSAVVGATVIGTTDPAPTPNVLGGDIPGDTVHLAGLSAARGTSEWQQSEAITAANVQQAGPDKIMVEAADASSGDDVISVLSAGSGEGRTIADQQAQTSDSLPWICQYDGRSTVVCDNADGLPATAAFGIDGATGSTLWQLPDPEANRTALTVTAVYDGLVYGTTASGPVVLNASTGKDVNDSPGVAPVAVDPDVGIALPSTSDQLKAYPAAG